MDATKIINHEFKRQYAYDNTVMLNMTLESVTAEIPYNRYGEKLINSALYMQQSAFVKYVTANLYKQAIKEYKNSKSGGFPFRAFEAVLKYYVTFNEKCHISMYRDQYEYTGGAHGMTVRKSDTFSLKTGRQLPLAAFFLPERNYNAYLIDIITKEADKNYEESAVYFEDYRDLIRKYYNESRYFLDEKGLNIYYLQYEIAPYAAGIIVFNIPYEMIDYPPSCK